MEKEILGWRMKRLLKNLIHHTGFDLIRYRRPGSRDSEDSSRIRSELVDLSPAELEIAESAERYK
jgi:hypothetical protein